MSALYPSKLRQRGALRTRGEETVEPQSRSLAHSGSSMLEPGGCLFRWQLTLLFSLFFLWGAANNLNDVLIRQFTKAFALSNVRASLVQTYANTYVPEAHGSLPRGRHDCTSVVRVPGLGVPYVPCTVAPQVQT